MSWREGEWDRFFIASVARLGAYGDGSSVWVETHVDNELAEVGVFER